MRLDDVGMNDEWGEAVDLVDELQRDSTSHLTASLAGWAWVPDPNEISSTLLLQAYLNAHRDTEKQPEPIRLPLPWTDDSSDDGVTPEQREALVRDFNERSAMRDL